VQASDLGKPRAACVAGLLKELNDAVAGAYVEEEPAHLLASDPAFFKDFTLVVATQASVAAGSPRPVLTRCKQMREDQLLQLDAACREHGVPLIMARSYGLAGHLRLSVAVRLGSVPAYCRRPHARPGARGGGVQA
jgi:amyloid beta precursor protein binding protein 1